MTGFIDWLANNWMVLVVPLAVFGFCLIALMWLRWFAFQRLERRINKPNIALEMQVLRAFRWPSIIWVVIIGIYFGVVVSETPAEWKGIIGLGLWTLLLISIGLVFISVFSRFIESYNQRLQLSRRGISITRNIIRITFLIIVVLIILEIWGVPTNPILLLIVVAVIVAALAFRDVVPNLYAGLQLNANRDLKVGDYIKLQSGEEGYVTEVGLRNTRINASDNSFIVIPNRNLLQSSFVVYGHGRKLTKSKEPFRFSSRLHLAELTGFKARNLKELVNILKTSSEPVVYYHTHHFLEQYFYLTPEPANDFSIWVGDALGDEVLSEWLASVNTIEFSDLTTLRDRFVSIIEEYFVQGGINREAIAGREFYFVKSVSIFLPVPYQAYDLREFVESLRKVSLGSLYFHMYESRLRLGRGQNDFSSWLETAIGEPDLANEISRIDPYTYSLEGLRSTLIQLIEKRLK